MDLDHFGPSGCQDSKSVTTNNEWNKVYYIEINDANIVIVS
jgi:hypothetical protein